jgi:hypothetical protein
VGKCGDSEGMAHSYYFWMERKPIASLLFTTHCHDYATNPTLLASALPVSS